MSKTKISEYSATANSNTDVGGINIDEGCAPSGINDAIRTLMAQLKNFQTGASGDTITVGGVLTVTGGSAAAPALTTSGDTNTGVLFPAADTIALTTGGTERARIDSSGNLGIGTSSPGAKLDVNSGTNSEMRVTTSGSGYLQVGQFTNGAFIGTSSTDATAGLLRFGTGGSVRATIDGSGNLGLGVTPSAWGSTYKAIDIGNVRNSISGSSAGTGTNLLSCAYYNVGWKYSVTGVAAARYDVGDTINGGHTWYNAPSGTAGNTISFTQAMTLDASGNLGIGTSSPAYKLDVKSASTGIATNGIRVSRSSVTTQYGVINYESGVFNNVCVNTAGTGCYWNVVYSTDGSTVASTPMSLDSSGNLLVGTTSVTTTGVGGATFVKQSLDRSILSIGSTSTVSGVEVVWFYNPNGKVGRIETSSSSTSYVTSSDYRLKDNVQPMTGALEKVAALKPCTYTWKVDGSEGQGFIAHELAEVVPDAVSGEKDAVDENGNPKYQGIDTSFLVATLTAAIQELKAELDAAKARIATLEA